MPNPPEVLVVDEYGVASTPTAEDIADWEAVIEETVDAPTEEDEEE